MYFESYAMITKAIIINMVNNAGNKKGPIVLIFIFN